MSKLVRESINLLNEELLGEVTFNDITAEIFKNPRSLKRLESDIRGVSDLNGDLYIVNTPQIIHRTLIEYLQRIYPVLPKSAGWDNDIGTFRNIVAWTRLKDTNTFALSESYMDLNLLTAKEWDFIEESTEKTKQKNPNFKFLFELIGNVEEKRRR